MKEGIHPTNYRPVVFKDMSNGDMFLSRSTCKTNETIEFEGETYPLVKLEISSTSHPFYTGKSKLVDTAASQVLIFFTDSIRSLLYMRGLLFLRIIWLYLQFSLHLYHQNNK